MSYYFIEHEHHLVICFTATMKVTCACFFSVGFFSSFSYIIDDVLVSMHRMKTLYIEHAQRQSDRDHFFFAASVHDTFLIGAPSTMCDHESNGN